MLEGGGVLAPTTWQTNRSIRAKVYEISEGEMVLKNKFHSHSYQPEGLSSCPNKLEEAKEIKTGSI